MTTFEPSTSSESESQSQSESFVTGCVLVVDDNDQVRHMLSVALETAGFTVIAASTQLEAQLRLAHTRPDAIVLDLQRSEAEGLRLLTLVRARPNLRDVPIVFLASADDEDFRWQAIRTGADWFGLRPLGMVELQTELSRLIREGRPKPKDRGRAEPPIPIRRLKATG